MDENLIELVRNHEELYNFEDKRYSDSVHKNKLWKELGDQLNNKGADYCKKRWESLRSQYRKICRLRKTKTGEAAKKTKKWKYEDEMSFLLPHMKDKERLTSVNIHLSSDESLDSIDNQPSENSAELDETEKTVSITQQKTPLASKLERQKSKNTRNKFIPPSDTAGSMLMKYILDQKAAETSKPQDALDHFFDGIKSTVKQFSPMDQHMAKTKIFNVVSQIEAKYVCGNNSQLLPQYQTLAPCNPQQSINIPSGPSSYSSDSTSSKGCPISRRTLFSYV